jgi:hypothetical protein
LWYTIGQAYGVWGRNFAELIRIAWPWMAVIALPLAVIVWLQSTDVGAAMRAARAGLRVAEPNPF